MQKEYGADIFGFGKKFHQKYPVYWRKWHDVWNEKFSEMEVDVNVHYEIKGRGRIVSPILKADVK
uniref:Ger(x)C family spore germination C-terminal domain-containing protein n=1 Tax=Paenibacillus sp. FSL M7-0896 TaxID=2921610 RepID=UPI00403E98A2